MSIIYTMDCQLVYVGTDVFSTSTDGMVFLWDIRKLVEPVEAIPLDFEKTGRLLGGISLEFESTMVMSVMISKHLSMYFLI